VVGLPPVVVTGPLSLAVTGAATGSSGLVLGKRLSDVCKPPCLVTAAQLQQVTGVAFTPVVPAPGGDGNLPPGALGITECAATTVAVDPKYHIPLGLASYALLYFDSPAAASATYGGFRAGVARGGGNPSDVGGLGDQAFVGHPGPLDVLKGTLVLNVVVALRSPGAPTGSTLPDAEIQVAQIILAQL
jgi:hypothetical protein